MEVRFIAFPDLPTLYCQLSGVKYEPQLVEPIIAMADKIKEMVLEMPENAAGVSREIYREVKKPPYLR